MAIEAAIAGVGEPASLLERELELGTVAALLQRVRAGRGGRFVIEGPAGIGKSALLDAACELAADDGIDCLWAEASELGSPVAFGVVRAALGELWPQRSAPDVDLDALGGPPAAAVLAASQRGVRAVRELAERAPVLLCVDDVQWADAASLRWLALLARRISGTRIGLALAVRVGELEREPAALRELLDDRAATVVRPAALRWRCAT